MTHLRRGRVAALLALGLVLASIVGLWRMTSLQHRADDAIARVCDFDPTSAHWSHGYGSVLPLSTLAAAVLAVAMAVCSRRAWHGSRLAATLGIAGLVFGAVMLVPAAIYLHGYFSYPGDDFTTVHTSPCGFG